MLKDSLEIVCVVSLFGKLIGDSFATVLSNEREIGYNRFALSTAPMYEPVEEDYSPLLYGLSTLFVFHFLFRPPIMLVAEQGNILAPLLKVNLAVGYAFGVSYLYDGVLGTNPNEY